MKRLLLVLLLVLPMAVHAQEKKKIDREQFEVMKVMMHEVMLPMFSEMMQTLIDVQLEALANPETAQAMAAYSRNYYEALIAAGFSAEEALALSTASGIPLFPIAIGQN